MVLFPKELPWRFVTSRRPPGRIAQALNSPDRSSKTAQDGLQDGHVGPRWPPRWPRWSTPPPAAWASWGAAAPPRPRIGPSIVARTFRPGGIPKGKPVRPGGKEFSHFRNKYGWVGRYTVGAAEARISAPGSSSRRPFSLPLLLPAHPILPAPSPACLSKLESACLFFFSEVLRGTQADHGARPRNLGARQFSTGSYSTSGAQAAGS